MTPHVSALRPIARGILSVLSAAVLVGCPQLLEDEFAVRDGSASVSNAGGAGGARASSASNRGDAGIIGGAGNVDGGLGGQGGAGGGASGGGGPGGGGQGGSVEPPTDPLSVLDGAIVHRYSFDGVGTTLVDSVGVKSGTFVGGTLTGDGRMMLSGSGQYGDLPADLLSVHQSVTIEAWIVWSGTADHQRIFDFGVSSTGVEDEQGSNGTHLYLTPKAPGVPGNMVLSYRTTGTTSLNTTPLVNDSVQHVAVVIDGSTHTMSIYRNGSLVAFRDHANELSQIEDVNCWLGRSQISGDPDFQGALSEFRIYAAALDADAIQLSFNAGEAADINPD